MPLYLDAKLVTKFDLRAPRGSAAQLLKNSTTFRSGDTDSRARTGKRREEIKTTEIVELVIASVLLRSVVFRLRVNFFKRATLKQHGPGAARNLVNHEESFLNEYQKFRVRTPSGNLLPNYVRAGKFPSRVRKSSDRIYSMKSNAN